MDREELENPIQIIVEDETNESNYSFEESDYLQDLTPDLERDIAEQIPSNNISVNLADRALAISGIMKSYNYSSRVHGALSESNKEYFAKRYGIKTDKVIEAMKAKDERLTQEAELHYEKLVAAAALRECGFDELEVQAEIKSIKNKLVADYGQGNSDGKKRERLVKKVQSTAEI